MRDSVVLLAHETETDADAEADWEYRPCVIVPVWVWVVVGVLALWRSASLSLHGFWKARPRVSRCSIGGMQVGLTISCNPCPALPAPSPRVGYLAGWTVGRLAGLGWLGGLNGRVSGWVDGRLNVGSGMEPGPEHRCFSPHQAKRGLGLETRVGEDEGTSTAPASCVQSTPLLHHNCTQILVYIPSWAVGCMWSRC